MIRFVMDCVRRPSLAKSRYSARAHRQVRLQLEALENRELLSAPGWGGAVARPAVSLTSMAAGSSFDTPAQIRHAYGFDQIRFIHTITDARHHPLPLIVPGDG